jgi:hypothetical protein
MRYPLRKCGRYTPNAAREEGAIPPPTGSLTLELGTFPAYCNAGNGVIGNGVTQTFGPPRELHRPHDVHRGQGPLGERVLDPCARGSTSTPQRAV